MAEPSATPSSTGTGTSAPSTSGSSTSTSTSTPSQSSSVPSSGSLSSREFARQLRSKPNGTFDTIRPADKPAEAANDNASIAASQAQEPTQREYSDDAPWYQRYEQGIHGVPAKELLEALERGTVPDALMGKLRLAMGEDGYEGSLEELRSGAMMRRTFTQKSQELAEQRRSFEAEQGELVNYLSNWKQDPQQLLYGMRRLGMPIQEVAQMLLQEAVTADKLNEAVPGSGDEWLQAQIMKAEHADLLRQHQQQEQARAQAEQAKKQESISTNLRNIAMKEFENAGLDYKPTAWNLFREHCAAVYEETGKLSRADVRRAVIDTKAQIEDYVRKYNEPTQRPTLGGPRLDGGAPRATNPSAPSRPGSRQLSSREFERQIRSGRF